MIVGFAMYIIPKLNFPMGNAVAAFHIEKGYRGETGFTFFQEADDVLV